MNKTNEEKKNNEIDYVSDSKAAISTQTPKSIRISLYLIIAVIVTGLVWANYAEIDISTTAKGTIIPSSRIQVIENLEGGIVKEIHVRQGDIVEKGQVLIQLRDTRFAAAYKKDAARYAKLVAEEIRLVAESQGDKSVSFPKELQQKFPKLVQNQMNLFKHNKAALDANIELLQRNHELAQKELDIVRPLAKQGVMSELERIRLERNINNIKIKILEKKDEEHSQARDRLNEIRSEKSLLHETLIITRDRMERTTIRSPMAGIVKKVNVTTIGEVVQPNDHIMEIVPVDKKLIVKANVRPADIGFMHPGQKGIVKISAYDFAIYGGLKATVERISADAVTDAKGDSFYDVLLKTNRNYLETEKGHLNIIPGMTVSVNIITGKKTVLQYLLKPILRAKEAALHER